MGFLFVGYGCLGVVIPTASVLALERHGAIAGTASALMGSNQLVTGAAVLAVAGVFAEGVPQPMVIGIAAPAAWLHFWSLNLACVAASRIQRRAIPGRLPMQGIASACLRWRVAANRARRYPHSPGLGPRLGTRGRPFGQCPLRYREDIVDGTLPRRNLSGCSRRGLRDIHYGAQTTHVAINGNLQSPKTRFDFQCRCFGRVE